MSPRTIAELIDQGRRILADARVDEPHRTSRLLLQAVLQADQLYLLTNPQQPITAQQELEFEGTVKRRAAGEPLQYITGHQEFYGLEFEVTPAVLIPRPETELVVEAVLEHNSNPAPNIIDIGTGSGCLAVTLAKLIDGARITALDISAEALEVARRNARRYGVSDRIRFLRSDLFSAFYANSGIDPRGSRSLDADDKIARPSANRFEPSLADFIVCNPPYVAQAEWENLMREVRNHEPRVALVSGVDSYLFEQRLLNEAPCHLKEGGILICELGAGQYPEILRYIDENVYTRLQIKNDLQGIPRTLTLRRLPGGPANRGPK